MFFVVELSEEVQSLVDLSSYSDLPRRNLRYGILIVSFDLCGSSVLTKGHLSEHSKALYVTFGSSVNP